MLEHQPPLKPDRILTKRLESTSPTDIHNFVHYMVPRVMNNGDVLNGYQGALITAGIEAKKKFDGERGSVDEVLAVEDAIVNKIVFLLERRERNRGKNAAFPSPRRKNPLRASTKFKGLKS